MKKSKIITITFFFILGILISSIILPINMGDLDEIWNYNFARNIAEGLIPYTDFNIITMPLLPAICGVFLKIFGNQLITMRILAVILNLGILITTYKILKQLKIRKYINFAILIGLTFLFGKDLRIDYNFLVLLFSLIIIYLEIKRNKKQILNQNKKSDIITGIIAGLSICTKQTTGILIAIALISYKIIFIKNKEELKEYKKIVINKIIGILIPLSILIIYFTANGMWESFIEYCITGIQNFSNNIPYTKLFQNEETIIKILAIIIPIIIMYMIIIYITTKRNRKEFNKNISTLFPFCLAQIILIFPIADKIHFLIAIYPSIIALIYIINKLIEKVVIQKILEKKKRKKEIEIFLEAIIKAIVVTSYILILINSVKILNIYIETKDKSKINHYNNIIIPQYLNSRINEIDTYIQEERKKGNKVYILDAEAAIYMIPLDIYNKDYDLFLKGNLGNKTQNEIMGNIQMEKDTVILIKKPENPLNWQIPKETINYVKENFNKIDEISIFDAYQKK